MNLVNFSKYQSFTNLALFAHEAAAKAKYGKKQGLKSNKNVIAAAGNYLVGSVPINPNANTSEARLKPEDMAWLRYQVGPRNTK